MGATHSPWDFSIDSGYRHYDGIQTMRYGEFGTQSPANLEVWHRTIPPKSQWPIQGTRDPVLIRKNVVQAVFSPGHWLLKDRIDRAFGTLDNLPDLVQAGQFLGAEGLRYATDALRRKGRRIGGFTSWDYNEPWPNGAGSYLVDYDGRPLMNYDFVRQALAPISLSLKHDSLLYNPAAGLRLEVWLASDASQAAQDLTWQLVARDRRGEIFAREEGIAAIMPLEARLLKTLRLTPPRKTQLGPVFLELRLQDAQGRLLVERLHVFSAGASGRGGLGGLLNNRQPDSDDDTAGVMQPDRPDGPANLAFVGNGAKPATASSEIPGVEMHRARGLNDGAYGNDHSWIGATPRASFQIDLGQAAEIGRFRLGRDRTGGFRDRGVNYLRIELSLPGQPWQTVFEQDGLTRLPGSDPAATLEIRTQPVRAQLVRVTVDPEDPAGGVFACVDEFEVYAPTSAPLPAPPQVAFLPLPMPRQPPIRRTELKVAALPMRVEGNQEVVELVVRNTGSMTALFLEPHPLIEYRTDLFIENNHCFIPPGQSRTITIRAATPPGGGLTLAQTGWRLSCWNADDVVIEPSPEVLLSLGRRDQMCREFDGYWGPGKITTLEIVSVEGSRPNPSQVSCLLAGKSAVRFEFSLSDVQAKRPARLRIHTADRSEQTPAKALVAMNGRRMGKSLPLGLGIQRTDPAHLAFPATVEFSFPPQALRAGQNVLEVRVEADGWFTWDAMDLLSWQ